MEVQIPKKTVGFRRVLREFTKKVKPITKKVQVLKISQEKILKIGLTMRDKPLYVKNMKENQVICTKDKKLI